MNRCKMTKLRGVYQIPVSFPVNPGLYQIMPCPDLSGLLLVPYDTFKTFAELCNIYAFAPRMRFFFYGETCSVEKQEAHYLCHISIPSDQDLYLYQYLNYYCILYDQELTDDIRNYVDLLNTFITTEHSDVVYAYGFDYVLRSSCLDQIQKRSSKYNHIEILPVAEFDGS